MKLCNLWYNMLTDIFLRRCKGSAVFSAAGNWNPFAGGTDEGVPVGSHVYHSEPGQGDYRLDTLFGDY